ncbi:ankyrin repeat protein [Grosmannia clavigera kw1407]|uniref:Ankyrin repeat protein n=1 Tax=Grosmannia clavigera (strain kw1407 / UAMH 11150) TaxID=655863 RepID=F0XJW3_GROCL|nr:ankyrin repeat protein [Grosmannia clavigera kw1407]EFX02070.1 ankyrin repeat protein [Grosmannia clavigera kw1407]
MSVVFVSEQGGNARTNLRSLFRIVFPSVPLPTPPGDFIGRLASTKNVPARQVVTPYIAYETELRHKFAEGQNIPQNANMIPIYDGHENLVKFCHHGRNILDKTKYIMPLPQSLTGNHGDPAITLSLADYRKNFRAFTHGLFHDMDWGNMVVAGSSALLPLLPYREKPSRPRVPTGSNPLEEYSYTARYSDIDIFLYGINEKEAINKIININEIILRIYQSPSEILTGFDVDCACVAYDGNQVLTNPRGITAIVTRTNGIGITRRSPSYENRLWKYRHQNFDVYWEDLDRRRVRIKFPDDGPQRGLARLLMFEKRAAKGLQTHYIIQRHVGRVDDNGDPSQADASGYMRQELPMGERFTSQSVHNYVVKHSKEPYYFGNISQVCTVGNKSGSHKNPKLIGKIPFIKDNPGRQMIGSFYPLTANDWTAHAYRARKHK